MTPEHVALIRQTSLMVEQAGERFAHRFYERLFELHPSASQLFPADPAPHRGKLVVELSQLAALAENLPAFLETASELGARHQTDGVVADDYPAVGDALVDAVADAVGPAWTPEAACAWRCLYCLMFEAMLEGAAGRLFRGCG